MRNRIILILVLLILTGCTTGEVVKEQHFAEQIVLDYYNALNNKDYRTMYGLISEGFKKLEPTAIDYETFEMEMDKFFDEAESIKVTEYKLRKANKKEAVVDYTAVITYKSGRTTNLVSEFTIRNKAEGWRLIHPYGKHIDLS